MRSLPAPALLAGLLAAAAPTALVLAQEPESDQAAPAPDVGELNPLSLLDKLKLDGFRDKPLFTPSRRRPEPPAEVAVEAPPPPEPAPERKPPPAEPPELKLAGVVEGPEGAVAVVERSSEASKIERLRLGDQVDGWLVTDIGSSSLTLTLDEREESYRLFERKGDSTASAAEPEEDDASDKDEPE